jgi:uncharacterized protein YbjT (DUF2867 family)
MSAEEQGAVLVTGATGFIGGTLTAQLARNGARVVAVTRRTPPPRGTNAVEWRTCDLLEASTLDAAFAGVRVAYYLVHSMGTGSSDFGELEQQAAQAFARAAARAHVKRIVYLGGPAPSGPPSEHLRSRLAVGEILRAGSVPTIELRASMVIGRGSASWQIVRDLAVRLPVMVLPRWLNSRTRPVALADVVTALLRAAEMPLAQSDWFDVPGPEILSGQQILERIAHLRGRRFFALKVPFLTPQLSALWLRLITRTDFALARELVLGLKEDLLPRDARFWELIGHTDLISFDDAARHALASE